MSNKVKVTINYIYHPAAPGAYNAGCDGTGYPWKAWALSPDGKDAFMNYGHNKKGAKTALMTRLNTAYESKDPSSEEVEIDT